MAITPELLNMNFAFLCANNSSFIGQPRVPAPLFRARPSAIGADDSNDGFQHADANDLRK
jgi:hypothetical protein